MTRSYRVRSARNKLCSKRGQFHQPYEHEDTLRSARLTIVCSTDSTSSPVHLLCSCKVSRPDYVSKLLQTAEEAIKDLVCFSDARSAVGSMIPIYDRVTNVESIHHLGRQYYRAAEQSVGDWDASMTILGNYLELIGRLGLPNTDGCWHMFRAGNSTCNLAATAVCALSTAVRVLTPGESSWRTARLNMVEWVYEIDVHPSAPWLVRAGKGDSTGYHWTPPLQYLYDWDSPAELGNSYEFDVAMAALAGNQTNLEGKT